MDDNQNTQQVQTQEPNLDNITVTKTGSTMTATIADDKQIMTNPTDDNAIGKSEVNDQKTDNQDNSNPEAEAQNAISKQQDIENGVKTDLSSKGIDFNALAQEYDENGELSQESLQALEKAGYPKPVVDAYIAGLEASVEKFVTQVKSYAGGEKEYEAIARFLQSQPQDVLDGFNAAIQSGNLNQIKLNIDGIKARMKNAYGTSNPSIMSGQQGAGEASGYTSVEQMTKDMKDPRYQKDPKFTREVMRKISNASIFG